MSKGALINIQVALICLAGSFQRLHHSRDGTYLFGQRSMATHSASTFSPPPLNVTRDTACNSHNLQCVICDPVIVLLLMRRTFDKVKVISSRSQCSVGPLTLPTALRQDRVTSAQRQLGQKVHLGACFSGRSSAVFRWRQPEACGVYSLNAV